MPMVSLKLMAGAARSMVVASARMTAAENPPRFSRAMRCASTVRGEDSVGVNVNTTQAGATTLLLPAQVVCRALKHTGGAGTLKGSRSRGLTLNTQTCHLAPSLLPSDLVRESHSRDTVGHTVTVRTQAHSDSVP
jgi:hypothetical protein